MEATYQIGDILAVDADWCNQTFYFLIEGDGEFDTGMGFVYPYRCLNNGETGRGNFQNPSTRKMA